MSTEAIWAKRVAAWRASGLTAREFSARHEFAAGTLLWWSSRLRRAKATRPSASVSIARVIAVPSVPGAPASVVGELASADADAVVIEIGVARVRVPVERGRCGLESVLDILLTRAARSAR
jgi:hypothetical protein